MALKAFDREQKTKKNTVIAVVIAFAVILIAGSVTYSFYEKQDVNNLADGTARYPDASEVEYTTTYNPDVHSVEDALNDLYDLFKY